MLQSACPDCGLDVQSFKREEVAALLLASAAQWQEVLEDDGMVRTRPQPLVWSALEYGAHVRDVCVLYLERLLLMLNEEGPRYPNRDQDATAIAKRYDLEDPLIVADQLVSAAGALADAFDALQGRDWDRTGFRSDGAAFTAESFARYFIHDPVYHLHDVRSGLDELN